MREYKQAYNQAKNATETQLRNEYGENYDNWIKPAEEFVADTIVIVACTGGLGRVPVKRVTPVRSARNSFTSAGNANKYPRAFINYVKKKVTPRRNHEIGTVTGKNGHVIDNGISTGRGGINTREIDVANWKKDPKVPGMYRDIKTEINRINWRNLSEEEREIIRARIVYNKVYKDVPTNPARATFLENNYAGRRMLTGDAVGAEGGVCRHQGIISTQLLEQLIKDKILRGKVFYIRGPSHGWAVYRTSTGEFYILDVAQGYFGPMLNKMFQGLNGVFYRYSDFLIL